MRWKLADKSCPTETTRVWTTAAQPWKTLLALMVVTHSSHSHPAIQGPTASIWSSGPVFQSIVWTEGVKSTLDFVFTRQSATSQSLRDKSANSNAGWATAKIAACQSDGQAAGPGGPLPDNLSPRVCTELTLAGRAWTSAWCNKQILLHSSAEEEEEAARWNEPVCSCEALALPLARQSSAAGSLQFVQQKIMVWRAALRHR